MNSIVVEDLTKKYGNHVAVNKISFQVKKGSLLGFLGVNGAGKTTVINMLATLQKPDEGNVKICGYTLGKEDEGIRKKIGIVYQQNCLDDLL
ncbi:MAG: ATP-binding cassette domain-containing protein, partial [Lachnospiraceae bacterium]